MSDTNSCPCGSEVHLEDCCLPFIQGTKNPTTALELLRARYTAFTRGDVDYILTSHHSRTRKDVKREEIEDWSKNSDWLGLNIAEVEGGAAHDQKGTIVFCAKYRADHQDHEHWEKSFFERENGVWYFLDAQGVQVGTYRRATPKTGRNDPCPCGSGKKFKKCCESQSR
jgi:SEC-C motif-containing protein